MTKLIRGKSKKLVIPIEDCVHPFVFIVNKKRKIYPASAAHFFVLKKMSKQQNFLNYREHDYDPFEKA